ncbi:unnamed protein product [Ectocarpus sp. CCAP 1310/34]|nr:unnamed protein product [Ectocarpus sp. CCAP 1310/34]
MEIVKDIKKTFKVWGMLCADDAGIDSRSAEGLARMMTIIVEVFREFGLTVSEKKTETLLMRAKDKPTTTSQPAPTPPLTIEAAGQKYAQTTEFRNLGGLATNMATSPGRSTTGAEERGRASGDMAGSSSTDRKRPSDSRSACSRRRRWRHYCTAA